MNKVIILSIPLTGTNFMRATFDWLGVACENFHPGVEGVWRAGKTVDTIPNGLKFAPLRDPLLAWISYVQRVGDIDWRRYMNRGHRIGFMPLMGLDGNRIAWEWLFSQDIAAFIRINGAEDERATDLRDLISVVGASTPLDFGDYVKRWKKAGSHGDDHPLKHAYYARDLKTLKTSIEQIKPIVPEFRARGCRFWWDDGPS